MCREPVLKESLIILTGCLCVISFGVGMASLHSVPSTCGCDFFVPPLDRPISSHLLDLLEIVICLSSEEGAVSVNMTFSTVSGDVVHTLIVQSNQTAQVLMDDLIMKHRDIGRYGVKLTTSHDVSIYGHMSYEADVMTLLPLAAMANSYLVPDLCTSLLEEQKVRLVVFSLVKNNTVILTTYSRFYGNDTEEVSDNSNSNISITDSNNSKMNKTSQSEESPQSEENAVFTKTSATNKTTRHYNFAAAFMTQYLDIESDVTVFLQSESPIGVMVLVTLPSSLEMTSEPVTVGSGKAGGPSLLGAGSLGDEEVIAAEMVLPAWSMGTVFYLPVLPVMSTINVIISGQHNTTVKLRVATKSSTDFTTHSLAAYTSLLLEQPIKDQQTSGHVWLSATSPVIVYVVTEVCVPGDRDSCFANGFFLPPLQQFFRCAANKSDGVCQVECPSFWHLSPCLWNQWLPSDSSPGGSSSSVKDSNRNVWEVQETVSETSINVTDICIVTNDSYMHFRLDLTSASFLPAGSKIGRPYNACVQNVIEVTGDGDATDNDCHYTIDEGNLKQIYESIDKDTSSECVQDMISRNTRGDNLQRMVDPLDRFFQYQDEDSQMPLMAVVTSLTVAILAVIGVISIYLLMEVMSRRRQIRNTKIRPFVS